MKIGKIPLPVELHAIFSGRALKELKIITWPKIHRLAARVRSTNSYANNKELFLNYIRQNPPTDTEWVEILLNAADIIDERYEIIEMMAAEEATK